MYTVLLADDESSILENLKTCIPWHQFGINTVLTASDGIQALQLLECQHVDLLMTDIQMPRMDGLALLHCVKERYPDTRCILLTAYSEFSYAREAVKLGVENYLLKPIQSQEIQETLEKAIHNLYMSKENSRLLFRNNILLRWVTGSITREELSERSSLLNINIYLPQFCVVLLKPTGTSPIFSEFCASLAKELSLQYEVHAFWDDRGQHVLLLGGSGLSSDALLRLLSSAANRHRALSFSLISVGFPVNSMDFVPQSYQSACRLMETADLSHTGDIMTAPSQGCAYGEDFLAKELYTLLCEPDEKKRQDAARALLCQLVSGVPANRLYDLFLTFAGGILHTFLLEFPTQETDIKSQLLPRIQLFVTFTGEDSFYRAANELLEYGYLLFCYYIEQLSPIVQSVIRHIHRHFADSLSIKEFCVKNKMSTAGVFV